MQIEASADAKPIRAWTDERLDFEYAPLRKSYVLASLPRSGSQFISAELWKTGLLGAPCEYLHPAYDMAPMLNRLKASSHSDYLTKLIACRTSPNGVFGMNAHVNHFRQFFTANEPLLEILSPLTYISVARRNKLAQAVSMAKAYQQASWTSRQRGSTRQLQYNRNMIEKCLETLEHQEHAWLQWFEKQGVTPFSLLYEDAVADPPGMVQKIIELLGVEDDRGSDISLPPIEKQSDNTNREWIARYQLETRQGGDPGRDGSQSGDVQATSGENTPVGVEAFRRTGNAKSDFFDRYDRFIKNISAGGNFSTAYVDKIRMRRRYDAIIGQNRSLFENKRVLDIMSSDGRWCLAALDAGAANVVGIEPQPWRVAVAKNIFAEYRVDPSSYQFINAELFSVLDSVVPETFDVILCTHLFELFDSQAFFRYMSYLRPRHIVLDTAIALGKGPIVRFNIRLPEVPFGRASGAKSLIMCTPSHELIEFMCEYFGFHWRIIDWYAFGIADWTGIHDYESDRRRTYVMDLIS